MVNDGSYTHSTALTAEQVFRGFRLLGEKNPTAGSITLLVLIAFTAATYGKAGVAISHIASTFGALAGGAGKVMMNAVAGALVSGKFTAVTLDKIASKLNMKTSDKAIFFEILDSMNNQGKKAEIFSNTAYNIGKLTGVALQGIITSMCAGMAFFEMNTFVLEGTRYLDEFIKNHAPSEVRDYLLSAMDLVKNVDEAVVQEFATNPEAIADHGIVDSIGQGFTELLVYLKIQGIMLHSKKECGSLTSIYGKSLQDNEEDLKLIQKLFYDNEYLEQLKSKPEQKEKFQKAKILAIRLLNEYPQLENISTVNITCRKVGIATPTQANARKSVMTRLRRVSIESQSFQHDQGGRAGTAAAQQAVYGLARTAKEGLFKKVRNFFTRNKNAEDINIEQKYFDSKGNDVKYIGARAEQLREFQMASSLREMGSYPNKILQNIHNMNLHLSHGTEGNEHKIATQVYIGFQPKKGDKAGLENLNKLPSEIKKVISLNINLLLSAYMYNKDTENAKNNLTNYFNSSKLINSTTYDDTEESEQIKRQEKSDDIQIMIAEAVTKFIINKDLPQESGRSKTNTKLLEALLKKDSFKNNKDLPSWIKNEGCLKLLIGIDRYLTERSSDNEMKKAIREIKSEIVKVETDADFNKLCNTVKEKIGKVYEGRSFLTRSTFNDSLDKENTLANFLFIELPDKFVKINKSAQETSAEQKSPRPFA